MSKAKKVYAERKEGEVRDCYIGAKFTKSEKDAFYKKHNLKKGNASKVIQWLIINGEIE